MNGELNAGSVAVVRVEYHLHAFLYRKALACLYLELTFNYVCGICVPCAFYLAAYLNLVHRNAYVAGLGL